MDFQRDDEFVAAQTCRDVRIVDALGHALQHQVADGVPVRVVDQFEAVQVDEQDRGRTLMAPCRPQQLVELAHELDAVRQPGQGSCSDTWSLWRLASS